MPIYLLLPIFIYLVDLLHVQWTSTYLSQDLWYIFLGTHSFLEEGGLESPQCDNFTTPLYNPSTKYVFWFFLLFFFPLFKSTIHETVLSRHRQPWVEAKDGNGTLLESWASKNRNRSNYHFSGEQYIQNSCEEAEEIVVPFIIIFFPSIPHFFFIIHLLILLILFSELTSRTINSLKKCLVSGISSGFHLWTFQENFA